MVHGKVVILNSNKKKDVSMNNVFKLVWNKTTQQLVVVSELAKSKTKSTTDSRVEPSKLLLAVGIVGAALLSAESAVAVTASTPAVAGSTQITAGSGNDPVYIATDASNVAIGKDAIAQSPAGEGGHTVAIGINSNASRYKTVAIGSGATAAGQFDTAIGPGASASGTNSVAIGEGSKALKQYTIAIGSSTKAEDLESISIGYKNNSTSKYTIAIGGDTNATKEGAVAIGKQSKALNNAAIAIGVRSEVNGDENGIAIGNQAAVTATANSGIAIGRVTESSGTWAVSIGRSSVAKGNNSVVIGSAATVNGNSSGLMGNRGVIGGDGSYVLGNSNGLSTTATNVSAIGNNNQIGGKATFVNGIINRNVAMTETTDVENSKVVGNNNYITSSNTYVLGSSVGVKDDGSLFTSPTVENSVYLGNDSTIAKGATVGTKNLTKEDVAGTTTTAGDEGTVKTANVSSIIYGGFAGDTAKGAVTVGSAGEERRIMNVAAGEISKTSTDAINGSQLYLVASHITDNAPFQYVDKDGKPVVKIGDKYYPAGTVTDANGNIVDKDGNAVQPVADQDSVVIKAKSTNPENITNVKGNLTPTYNKDDFEIDATTGAPKTTKASEPTKSVTAPTADQIKAMYNNVATVGDVLNAGWNLQGNGSAVDFVKPYDTVNFINGVGTTVKVKADDNGKVSTVQVNSLVAVTDKDGNVLVQGNDNKWYKAEDLVNGKPKNDAKPVDASDTQVNVINPSAPNNTKGDATQLGNVAAGTETLSNPVDKDGNQLVKDKDNKYYPAGTELNEDGSVKSADAKPVETQPTTNVSNAYNGLADLNGSNATNALTVEDAKKLGWVVSASGNDYADDVRNANRVDFVGEDGVTVEGKTDDNGVRTITTKINVDNKTTEITYKTTTGETVYKVEKKNDDGTTTVTYNTKRDGKGDEVSADNITGSQISAILPKTTVNGDEVSGDVKIVDGDTTSADINDNGEIKIEVKTGTSSVENGKAKADTADGKVATIDDVVETINEVYHTVAAGTVTGTNGENTYKSVTNATTDAAKAKDSQINAGETVNYHAGQNIKISGEGSTIEISTVADAKFNTVTIGGDKSYKDADGNVYTKNEDGSLTDKNGNKLTPDGNGSYTNATGDTVAITEETKAPITISTNNEGKNTVSGLDDNLPATVNNADPKKSTTEQTRPTDVTGSNAATVNDVLNSGWNLQAEGSAVDFVKPYDTVNFVGENGVSVTSESTGEKSTIKISVDLGTIKGEVVKSNEKTITVDGEKKDVVEITDDKGNKTYYEKDNIDPTTGKPTDTTKALTPDAGTEVENKGSGFVDGNQVADAIQKSGFYVSKETDTSAVDFNNKEEKINPDDKLKFADGTGTTVNLGTVKQLDDKGEVSTTTVVKVDIDQGTMDVQDGKLVDKSTEAAKDALTQAEKALTDLKADPSTTPEVLVGAAQKVIDAQKLLDDLKTKGEDVVNAEAALKTAQDALNALKADENSTPEQLIEAANKALAAEKALEKAQNKVATVQNVVDAVNKSGFNLKTSATAEGEKVSGSDELINPGDAVEMVAGKNLTVKQEADGKVTFATKDKVAFTEVKVGDTVLNNGGLTIKNGPSITAGGIDAGGKKITNVADGEISPTSKDAVNGSQLYNVAQNINNRLGDVNKRIDDVDRAGRRGAAVAGAIGMLPQPHLSGKSLVGVATTHYRGEQALAVGYSRLSDNSKHIIRLSGSSNLSGKKDVMVGAAYGYQW